MSDGLAYNQISDIRTGLMRAKQIVQSRENVNGPEVDHNVGVIGSNRWT